MNYWLFQNNPDNFRLKDALREEALKTFPIHSHKKNIKKGDRVIIWQTGSEAGCYAIATVASEVEVENAEELETTFYNKEPKKIERVELNVDYNLWSNPITKDIIPLSRSFDRFYAGLPGTNYKATKAQFTEILQLIQQQNVMQEPEVAYNPQTSLNHPLNLILYGSPGTGKTFHTINYALSIIENRTLAELALEERQELRTRFESYMEEGWVQFVTFHPSFTYEDFVEGIKPQTVQGKVLYDIEDGVLKHMATQAKRHLVDVFYSMVPVMEISVDYDTMYQSFLSFIQRDEFESFRSRTGKKMQLQKIDRTGNLTVRPENSFLSYSIHKTKLKKLFNQFPTMEHIEHTENDISHLLGGVNTRAYWSVLKSLKDFQKIYVQEIIDQREEEQQKEVEEQKAEPIDVAQLSANARAQSRKFVLIIDEINRGNIAGIFGDLITLIEPDKREGSEEALQLVLPYSKTWFSLPTNFHIIGTMNTADRSVEALDSALRRRFTFVELQPQPELLTQPPISGVDLNKMLTAINNRIAVLLDADHAIGHSYFMKIKSLAELKTVFSNKILPLLEEYFYGDLGKVGLILGKDFIDVEKSSADIFADFDYEYMHEIKDGKVYRLKSIEQMEASSFIRIYDKGFE